MEIFTKKYTLNAVIILGLILVFSYITTYVHELGHAAMVFICGGSVLQLSVNLPLSFDNTAGYVLTNLPYNVPIVSGGVLATTIVAVILCLAVRRTTLSYLMLSLSVCTLYNAAYSLVGSDDITWLVMHSWWTAMICLGLVAVNIYVTQQGMNDLFDDMWQFRTIGRIGNIVNTGRRLNLRLHERLQAHA